MNGPKCYIGVDPGLTGAVVGLDPDGSLLLAELCPLFNGQPDPRAAAEIIARLPRPFTVTIEQPIRISRSGDSDSGYRSLLTSVRFWRAAIGAKHLVTMVVPRTWQVMLTSVQGATTKAKSIAWCRTFLPALDLRPGRCTTDQDGLADAACLAEYGRRRRPL